MVILYFSDLSVWEERVLSNAKDFTKGMETSSFDHIHSDQMTLGMASIFVLFFHAGAKLDVGYSWKDACSSCSSYEVSLFHC